MITLQSKCLTLPELQSILDYINVRHKFGITHSRFIKYIRPVIDMRDSRCFRIELGRTTFDFRETENRMYDNIMQWLKEDEI
jgi:putative IMPACT (imprinted ancient) family translation regulator